MSGPMYGNHTPDELYDNSAYSVDISNRMQVPKSIRIGGSPGEDGIIHSMYTSKSDVKYEMKVPDRILVVGQDRHVGMKAPPHELVLENSILSMDNNFPPVRVQTPPRSITVDALAQHNGHDQMTGDTSDLEETDEEGDEMELSVAKELVLVTENKRSNDSSMAEPPQLTLTAPQLTEEVFVLRQQIGRLHRRMAGLEREQQQRQQRDALVISLGAVYLVWKVILWLTRSP
uniref:Mitochondrial fission factor n=1 Tax=Alona affinis TaxID=381656 RepID=A0A9N6WP12_9CRUS|nr:EOG090X08OG [Alona affinis]